MCFQFNTEAQAAEIFIYKIYTLLEYNISFDISSKFMTILGGGARGGGRGNTNLGW